MEIIEMSRKYKEIDGDFKFDRKQLILQKNNAFFYAYTFDRPSSGDGDGGTTVIRNCG
jgi:hypothetical protein